MANVSSQAEMVGQGADVNSVTGKVSVVVPCFNSAGTLARALRSVALQSLPPLEVIVVDDASSDASADVALSWGASSSVPLVLVRLPHNSGPAAARNAGWARAQGEFIAFLDADDAWHPQKLGVQHNVMLASPDLSLCGHGFLVEPDEDAPYAEIFAVGGQDLGRAEMLTRNRLPTPSVMLRRDLKERFREDQRLSEDYLLWLEVVLGGGRARWLDVPMLRLFKSSYGEGGLSVRLWPMERAELQLFARLRRSGLLSTGGYVRAAGLSFAKFLRRLVYVRLNLFRATR